MSNGAKDDLARRLSDYPKEAQAFFNDGIAAASKLSEATRADVLKTVIANFQRGSRGLPSAALRAVTNQSARDSEQIAAVYSLIIGLLSESEATPDDLVEAGKSVIFSPENEEIVREIATSICAARQQIKASLDKARLGGEVLPSFYSLDTVVDLRIRVVDGAVTAAVPVIIAHIDTDTDQELWVQFTKVDLEDIVKQLSKCLEDVKAAETLEPRKS